LGNVEVHPVTDGDLGSLADRLIESATKNGETAEANLNGVYVRARLGERKEEVIRRMRLRLDDARI
jgi:hypothetical protein